MKNALVTLGLVAVGAVFALSASSAPPGLNPVVNPGFEQGCPPAGPPTGWTVDVTGGSWTQTNVGTAPFPFEGNCAAIGVTDGPGVFQTMSSTPMNLGAGQTLTGWARFLDGEEGGFPCTPALNDRAEIRLLRTGPTPGFVVAKSFESDDQGPDSGWVKWTGKTFSSGAWVIQYRVRNAEDDICDSSLMGDANGLGSVSIGPKP